MKPDEPTNAEIKAIWREHGGSQHGPKVEQYYIEEQAFYRFARDLLARHRNHSPAVEPEQRCPSCGTRFAKVNDVDAHIETLGSHSRPGEVERHSEALFRLSARLRDSGFLNDDGNHAAYEAVVASFAALSRTYEQGIEDG